MVSNKVYESYLLVKGRLRLGRMRSGFAVGLVSFPLTAGLYWCVWMDEVERELNWHVNGNIRNRNRWRKLLYVVPGVHMVSCWKLSRLMEQAEAQNQYNSFSKYIALLSSLFPPIFLIYFQHNLNRHWYLHASSFSSKAPRNTE